MRLSDEEKSIRKAGHPGGIKEEREESICQDVKGGKRRKYLSRSKRRKEKKVFVKK